MKKIKWKDIIFHLYKRKIWLVILPLISAIIIALFTLIIPNEFKAQANLIPNKKQGIDLGLISGGNGVSNLASSLFGGASEETNRYYLLLESYETNLKVINEFDLMNVYETKESKTPIKNTLDKLKENTNFEAREEGNFVIQVWDESPERAKNMADFYIDELNRRNIEISTSEASKYRYFLENRYLKAKLDMDSLRNSLKEIQEKYGVIELPTQVESNFSVIAELSSQKILSELKVEILESKFEKISPEYMSALLEDSLIEDKLNEIYSDSSETNLFLNISTLPEVASMYYETLMQIEIQSEVQRFLFPVYEQAKMEEVKSLPIVSIIDHPVVGERKDRPRRSIIVIVSYLSISLLTLIFIILELRVKTIIDYLQSENHK